MESQRSNGKDAEIISTLIKLKKAVRKELPKQKEVFEDLDHTIQANKLMLDGIKLEISKFTKGVRTSTKNQTESMGDLIQTVDSGFSEFQNHLKQFSKRFVNKQKGNITEEFSKFSSILRGDLNKIRSGLSPLGKVLKEEKFLKFIQEYEKQLTIVMEKISNKIELSTTELLASQKTLSSSDMVKNLEKTLNTEISTNIKKIGLKIDNSPIPGILNNLEKQIKSDISSRISSLENKIDRSPVSNQLKSLKEQLKSDISSQIRDIDKKIDKSPVPNMMKSLERTLDKGLGGIINDFAGIFNKKFKIIESPKYFDPIYNKMENIRKNINQNIIKELINSISQSTSNLSKEKSSQNILRVTEQIQNLIKKTGKEASLENIKQLLINNNSKLEVKNIQDLIREHSNSAPTKREILDLKQELQTKSKENLISLEDKIKQLNNFANTLASSHNLKEFRLVFEKSFPTMKTEIITQINILKREHQDHSKLMENMTNNLSKINHQTNDLPTLSSFIMEDLYSKINKSHEDILSKINKFSGKIIKTEELATMINEKVAMESTLREILKFSSAEGHKKLLLSIKDSILPIVSNYIQPLAKENSVNSATQNILNTLKLVDNEINKSQESMVKSYNLLKENRNTLSNLPNKDEFEIFQNTFNVAINERLPELIENSLLLAAREESLEKMKTETRGDLKAIFETQTLLKEKVDTNLTELDEFVKIFDGYSKETIESLKKIKENVSEGTWEMFLDKIRASVSRLATEESLVNFKSYYERQQNELTEINEDIKQKILINQTKITGVQDSVENITTHEDIINLAEILVEQIKNPLEKNIVSKLEKIASENTIKTNHEVLMENLKNLSNHDDFVDLKQEQTTMNKFLFKLLKIVESNTEQNQYIEEQIESLSEKLSLVFEFIKRVSGI